MVVVGRTGAGVGCHSLVAGAAERQPGSVCVRCGTSPPMSTWEHGPVPVQGVAGRLGGAYRTPHDRCIEAGGKRAGGRMRSLTT